MPRFTDQVAIVGIGETRVGRLPGLGATEIQALAVLNALEDAGIALSELDGLVNLDPYTIPNSMFSSTLTEYLGIRPRFISSNALIMVCT